MNEQIVRDFFEDILRLQHIKREELTQVMIDYVEGATIAKEIRRLKFYLLDKPEKDRSIILEMVMSDLFFAYYSTYQEVNTRDSDDIERSLKSMYGGVIATVHFQVAKPLRIQYSDEFMNHWRECVGFQFLLDFLADEAIYPYAQKSQIVNGVALPDELNTTRAQTYFQKALERGWFEREESGLRWNKRYPKVALAYFCIRVYCPTGTERLPEKALNNFLRENRIGNAASQITEAKKTPKWQPIIDSIFDEPTASTS